MRHKLNIALMGNILAYGVIIVGFIMYNIHNEAFADTDTTSYKIASYEHDNKEASAVFPPLLSDSDRALYEEIFTIQQNGAWGEADLLIKKIQNKILMGHVLFQRYMHPTKYRSKYSELKNWLKLYYDLPGAKQVYSLAMRRKPKNAKAPHKASTPVLPSFLTTQLTEKAKSPNTKKRTSSYWDRSIRSLVHQGQVTVAYNQLRQARKNKKIKQHDYVANLGHIARGYFRYDFFEKSYKVAQHAMKVDKNYAALAGWWGGLSAWYKEEYTIAASLFSLTQYTNDTWLHDAGIYWAHRAFFRANKPQKAFGILYSQKPLREITFYGILRKAVLGEPINLNIYYDVTINKKLVKQLYNIKVFQRIIALTEVNYKHKATQEFRAILGKINTQYDKKLLAFARYFHLEHIGAKLAKKLYKETGILYIKDLFPILRLDQDNFVIDLTLIHAIIRQESGFYSAAGSSKGAQGMMQLMPATASFIGNKNYRNKNTRKELHDVSLNISLGERYIRHLNNSDNIINNNLILIIAAYNAGPGNILKWSKKLNVEDDPLLYIESLPARETRIYLEHVLANLWIYRSLYGKKLTSLSTIIHSQFPHYNALYQ